MRKESRRLKREEGGPKQPVSNRKLGNSIFPSLNSTSFAGEVNIPFSQNMESRLGLGMPTGRDVEGGKPALKKEKRNGFSLPCGGLRATREEGKETKRQPYRKSIVHEE